jgi:hypothetical protein
MEEGIFSSAYGTARLSESPVESEGFIKREFCARIGTCGQAQLEATQRQNV